MGTVDLEGPQILASKRRHDELLATPLDADGASSAGDAVDRVTASYEDKDARFRISARVFERQYAPLYFSRLLLMRQMIKTAMAATWPGLPVVEILRVAELEECCVVGTVFKEMKLKPSIMDEYKKDKSLKQALGVGSNFCSETDSVILEDDGARMVLTGPALKPDQLVTGLVVGFRGQAQEGGDFVVSEVFAPGMAPQAPLPPCDEENAPYVALVSGLDLASPRTDMLRMQLLVDFLTGNLGAAAQQALASRVCRLVVAGGSVGRLEELAAGAAPHSRQQAARMQPITDMDVLMTELAAALPVDLMPGPDDPANVSLPQQPLHRALMPGAAPYCSFCRTTNPHDCEVGGVRLLATSGQPITDLARNTRGMDRLALMERCLRWRHLAPTAPDSLTCYPFADDDPFIINECPHVFCAGGQNEFSTALVEGEQGQRVRLVALPSFAETGLLVLVNLATLQCQTMVFEGQYRAAE